MSELLDQIRAQLGDAALLTGADVGERSQVDESLDQPCKPEVVLRPGSTAEVSTLLQLCNAARQPLVTQGGMTGLAGGATPQPGEWALSLERMTGITELDRATMTVSARAGTPLQVLQQAAADAGLMLPLDLGARGSCTIGGNVSTNAGGNAVIQYGMARALVLGLEAVLADGTVITSKNKLLKNNAGFDLKQLFIGSEGTLGVVTEVVLRLFPAAPCKQSAMCTLESFAKVVEFFHSMKRRLGAISAFEVMWENYYRYAIEHVEHTRDAFEQSYPYYVLVETEGASEGEFDRFQSVLTGEMEAGRVIDAVLAKSLDDRREFWEIRDAVGDFMRSIKHKTDFDIGIPLNVMEQCIGDIEQQLSNAFADIMWLTFGHLGDGNIHIQASTGRYQDKQRIYDIVYEVVGRYHGSITAEHGIGRLKKRWLHLSRTQQEIALMRTLKQALDPNNILNPGRVI